MAAPRRRILIVEDDPKAADIVTLYLEDDGYQVLRASDGILGLDMARKDKPDLIVLDLLMPGMNGLEVCQALRKESEVPIIMLTAMSTEQDKLKGLDLGADDYVTKPFSPRELAARVRTVLRRSNEEDSFQRGPQELEWEGLKIDFHQHRVEIQGKKIRLTPTEFRLLAILAREPNRVLSRTQLVDRAFGYDFEGLERTVDVHILNLRRKIEPDTNHPTYIKTIYGMGYKFGAPA